MDMSKYRGMFLSESAEHLKHMSRLVIALEEDPANREAIDSLFREAHSVKGMAASMGYDETAELAHHLEDLLDGFRKSGQVSAAAVDRILAGTDLLEGLLEDIAADRPERAVATFLAEPLAPPAAAGEAPDEILPLPLVPPVVPASPPPAVSAAAPRPDKLLIKVSLAADAAAPAARALLLLRHLAGVARVVASIPAETQLLQGMPVHHLEIKAESATDPETLRQRLLGMADVAEVTVATVATLEEPAPALRRREDAARTVRVRTDLLDRFINLTGELITTRYMLQTAAGEGRWSDTRSGLDLLARLITDLHGHVLQVRMMPLESITGRLPRLVRDLNRKTGKDVRLRLEGGELELDRAILEELADPLVHMVRNAMDHGIEAAGEVSVRAWREKDLVVLEVADDGRGIDPALVRRQALAKGLLSPAQGKLMRDRDVLQLICLPGFSTAAAVTETSGRGVGMDVVKAAVENLGGTLEIASQPGQGTRFLLHLPLSVAIIKILLVRCEGRLLGLPITRVVRVLEIARTEVKSSARHKMIALEEEMIPLVSLQQLLGLPEPPARDILPVVVTEVRGRRLGLAVDGLAGQREAFVKTLAFPLDRIGGMAGATVLGDGKIVFIIDPQSLLEVGSEAPVAVDGEVL